MAAVIFMINFRTFRFDQIKMAMKAHNTRRNFLQTSTLIVASFALTPVTALQAITHPTYPDGFQLNKALPGKHPELRILNDRPINAETPAHLLDEKRTPARNFFVRNNGIPPENIDLNTWTLTIEGESAKTKKTYTIQDLKRRFKAYSYELVLECGGNGRSEFNPPAKGNQWSTGAVGCAKWTGVRLRDVMEDAGIKNDAVYIGYYGKDTHLSGNPDKVVISRGVPLEKALQEESLIAWNMNDEPLPLLHGYPLRLVFGGWPASCSGKWLSKIVIRNKIHDGPKMTGQSYRVPCKPVPPGAKVADEDMCIIEAMPIKSLITYPKSGAIVRPNQKFNIRGHAWAGDVLVKEVLYSINHGSTWNRCMITPGVNLNSWSHFEAEIKISEPGFYELWAKATDENGESQPMILPGWNPRGYLNNACHRIAIKVEN